jgi:hypothetical protein
MLVPPPLLPLVPLTRMFRLEGSLSETMGENSAQTTYPNVDAQLRSHNKTKSSRYQGILNTSQEISVTCSIPRTTLTALRSKFERKGASANGSVSAPTRQLGGECLNGDGYEGPDVAAAPSRQVPQCPTVPSVTRKKCL